jgi:hypothetical protein
MGIQNDTAGPPSTTVCGALLFEKHGNDHGRIRAKYIKDCL